MGHRAGTSAKALAPLGPLFSHQAAGARGTEACGQLGFHLCMRSYAQPKGALPASEAYGRLAYCRLRGHSCLWLQLPGESDPQDSGPVQWRRHSCGFLCRNPFCSFCLALCPTGPSFRVLCVFTALLHTDKPGKDGALST